MGTGAREAFTIDLAEAMIDAARSPIMAVDVTGRVMRWNRAAATLTGVSADAIRGRMFSEIVVWPEDRDRWQLEFDRILSGKKPILFEIRWKKNQDGFTPLTCSCSAAHDREGGLRYVVCSAEENVSQGAMSERIAEFHDVARYMHDTITQDLVALSFQLTMLEEGSAEFPLREELQDSVRLIDRCCRHMRVISSLLAAPSLDGITLEAGIEQLVAFIGSDAGLAVSLDLDPVGSEVGAEAQLLMFAAVKAWLSRSVWSRKQPRMSIQLRSPHSGGAVLTIETSPLAVRVSTEGWSILRERAKALGGEFSIAGDADHIVARMSFPGRTEG